MNITAQSLQRLAPAAPCAWKPRDPDPRFGSPWENPLHQVRQQQIRTPELSNLRRRSHLPVRSIFGSADRQHDVCAAWRHSRIRGCHFGSHGNRNYGSALVKIARAGVLAAMKQSQGHVCRRPCCVRGCRGGLSEASAVMNIRSAQARAYDDRA